MDEQTGKWVTSCCELMYDEGQNQDRKSFIGAINGRASQAKRTADATEVSCIKSDAVAVQQPKGDSPEARKTWTSGDVKRIEG
jgi:hypothetical protein